ncbi:MAG: G5 domain-containing protein [Eubacterium sp.]
MKQINQIKRFIRCYRKQTTVIAGLFVLVVAIGITCAFNASKEIKVIVDQNTAQSGSAVQTDVITVPLLDELAQVLEEKGYPTSEEYTHSVSLDKKVKDVDTVIIKKNAKGQLIVSGQAVDFNSGAQTVGELLETNNVKVSKEDIVTPAKETPLTTEVKEIKVARVEIKEEKSTKEVPFEIEEKENATLEEGTRNVITPGVLGQAELRDKVTYQDGKETVRENIETKIITEPVKEVAEVGTKKADLKTGSFGNGGVASGQMFTANCTAYTHTGNATASGAMPRAGFTVAADLSVFPIGTQIYIPYFGTTFTVQDSGGAVSGNVIDIFMDSESECIAFGRQNLEAYVVN